jgi:hypothetical protein
MQHISGHHVEDTQRGFFRAYIPFPIEKLIDPVTWISSNGHMYLYGHSKFDDAENRLWHVRYNPAGPALSFDELDTGSAAANTSADSTRKKDNSPSQKYLRSMKRLPLGRSQASAWTIGGHSFLFGGIASLTPPLPQAFRNPANNRWEKLSPVPVEMALADLWVFDTIELRWVCAGNNRIGPSSFSCNFENLRPEELDDVYCAGMSGVERYACTKAIRSVAEHQVYHPGDGQSLMPSAKISYPYTYNEWPEPRAATTMAVLASKGVGYMLGGYSRQVSSVDGELYTEPLDDLWFFGSLAAHNALWQNYRQPREEATHFLPISGSQLGNTNGTIVGWRCLGSGRSLSPGSWPLPRFGHASWIDSHGGLVVFGGVGAAKAYDEIPGAQPYADIWYFSIAGGWQLLPELPSRAIAAATTTELPIVCDGCEIGDGLQRKSEENDHSISALSSSVWIDDTDGQPLAWPVGWLAGSSDQPVAGGQPNSRSWMLPGGRMGDGGLDISSLWELTLRDGSPIIADEAASSPSRWDAISTALPAVWAKSLLDPLTSHRPVLWRVDRNVILYNFDHGEPTALVVPTKSAR